MSTSMGPRSAVMDVTGRPVLATYDAYVDAQKAVDTLSDNGFPVQNVAIVGVDVRLVESVIGRLTWGKAALSGMLSGAWFGVLIGLFVGLFSSTTAACCRWSRSAFSTARPSGSSGASCRTR